MIAIIRIVRAMLNNVPFRKKVWYNFRAYIRDNEIEKYPHIEIFDKTKDKYSNYIPCPDIGGTVIYNESGRRYLYKVIGFKNESSLRDWLYQSDNLNPIIEFMRPLKDGEYANLW